MANLKEIQRKIKSVKNTQKTTRAMKLVSSAKLKRAEEVAKRSRVYAAKLNEMINEIAQKVLTYSGRADRSRIVVENPNPKTVDIIFVTADKGLCGGFNAQTLKRVNSMMSDFKSNGVEVRLSGIGRKGIDYYRFNKIKLIKEAIGLSSAPDYASASKFISEAVEEYLNGSTDKIILIHNGYVNMITQVIKVDQILPVSTELINIDAISSSELEVESEDEDLLFQALLRRYMEYTIYYALLDSMAAEHSARMQAMDSATNNAKDMVKTLSVKYNKARQEAITTELIEIISGVESMK